MPLKHLLFLCTLAVLGVPAVDAQRLPPRDPASASDGGDTGTIRGQVIAADTHKPIFRASVSLTWVPDDSAASAAIAPRQTVTDSAGAFQFTHVPAGSYRLLALPGPFAPQYVRIGYGAQRPVGDPTAVVDVTARHTTAGITIALPRGGIIAGTVSDDVGAPLAGAHVVGFWFAGPGSRGQRFNEPVATDDLGHYRLYGLLPGEYVVLATPMSADAEGDDSHELSELLSTYFPGSPNYDSAQRVRIAEGQEVPAIDFRVARGHTYAITGTIIDSRGDPLVGAEGRLVPRIAASFGGVMRHFGTDDRGGFVVNHVQPGRYFLAARGVPPDTGHRGKRDPEVIVVPVDVVGTDTDGLTISTKAPPAISGEIAFEPEAPKSLPSMMRVYAEAFDTNEFVWPAPPGIVRPDLSFTMTGLMSGCMLRLVVPGWFVKSVTVNGVDVTDIRHQFTSGDRVTILLTSTGATLEGTVTTIDGGAATNGGVLMFAAEPTGWTTTSVRMRRARLDSRGRFKIAGLLPGQYYITAGPRERVFQPGFVEPSYFEAFANEATTIVLGEREHKVMNLVMLRRP